VLKKVKSVKYMSIDNKLTNVLKSKTSGNQEKGNVLVKFCKRNKNLFSFNELVARTRYLLIVNGEDLTSLS